ncbi:MAG: hypothetical protein LQ342_006834 [Letrouitia transgressa]|nr:MAG: hypothetical protein LQ342_006834 [Letrouitia transgressa]
MAVGDARPSEKQTRVKQRSSTGAIGAHTPTQMLSNMRFDQFSNDSFPWDDSPSLTDTDMEPYGHSVAASSECADSYLDNAAIDFGGLITPGSFGDISSLLGGFAHDSVSAEPAFSGPPAPPAPPCPNRSVDKPQDCMTLALNTLQSLHIAPPTCSLASGSSSKAPFSLGPTIEHVLATNRTVLDSVSVVLSCYCSLNAQLALVLTLIGSKLIAWYRAILKCDDHVNDTNPEQQNVKSGGLDTVAERVLYLPVTVGKYKLDGADKGKMRAQLVLSELRHVVKLVEQLAKHFGDEGPGIKAPPGVVGKPGASGTSVAPMCEQLQIFLKEGVQSVTKEAIRILRDT